MVMKNVGVLALQGAVEEHIRAINSLGFKGVEIRKPEQLKDVDGLILPGGESTAIGKLMKQFEFVDEIRAFASEGKPVFGTCAGMVLLCGGNEEGRLNLLDAEIVRNGFGRRRESFEAYLDVKGFDDKIPAVFIRAPYIASTKAEVLYCIGEKIVFVKQANIMGCSFHPELTDDNRIIEMFIDMI